MASKRLDRKLPAEPRGDNASRPRRRPLKPMRAGITAQQPKRHPSRPSDTGIDLTGADGGTRTRTPLREADFKSAASTFSPRPLRWSAFAQPFLWVAAELPDQHFEL